MEPNGSLVILENDGGRLQRILLNSDRSMKSIETVAQAFSDPIALLCQGANSFLVAERASGHIYRILNGNKTLLAEGFSDISSIRFDEDGNLYVCELSPGNLWSLNLTTNKKELILNDLDFPSDALPVSDGLIVGELVGSAGQLGRISKFKTSLFSLGIFDRRDWELTDIAIDPLRIVADPTDDDRIYVSVRSFEAGTILSRFLEGGIYHLNQRLGLIARRFAESLYGPTDMVGTAAGMYVLEEKAERILFIDWQGNIQVIWDGLGYPSAFALSPEGQNLFVAENLPDPQIVQVKDSITFIQDLPFLYRNEYIGGIAQFENGSYLLSLTSAGVLLRIDQSGNTTLFSNEIFAPGKIRLTASGTVFVLDSLMNTIYELNPESGAILGEYPGAPHQLSDFTLETDSANHVSLFAADSVNGSILEYQQTGFSKRFTLSDEKPTALLHIPDQGFLIATNHSDGHLYWYSENGESSLLTDNFPNLVDIQWNVVNGFVYCLSQNGWIRRLTLDFQLPQATPTPTPTFLPTSTPTSTPVPSPTPTPTPTIFTAISDWIQF